MSEHVLKGQGSSAGIAIGHVLPLTHTTATPHYWIPQREISSELKRVSLGFKKTETEWQEIAQRLSRFYSKDPRQILESHILLLKDDSFQKQAGHYIKEYQINAEWALELTAQHFKITFSKNKEDLDAVVSKVLHHLQASHLFPNLLQKKYKNCILACDNLSPAEVASLPHQQIRGFITRGGGLTSHFLILARSLQIPAVSGVDHALQHLPVRKKVILDGFEGKIILNPTRQELKKYRELSLKHRLLEKLLLQEALEKAYTMDQKRMTIEANVDLAEEGPLVLKYGAEGIGLFRTESLFWNPLNPPKEETQFRLYKNLLKEMKGHPVTFRTLDVVGEEWLQTQATNPALGLRGIRFGLKEKQLLKTQLRAMLRASPNGPLKILLPMVGCLEEVEEFKKLLEETQMELTKERKPFAKKIPVGVMVEVPSACMILSTLAKQCDFFAIGTNDLLQYTLALDRTNEQVAAMYSPFQPAVLKMLNTLALEAKKAKKEILLCGELAADPLFLPLLIGLGLNHFSMNPQSIPKTKKNIRSLSFKKLRGLAKKILKLSHRAEIEKELKNMALELDTF